MTNPVGLKRDWPARAWAHISRHGPSSLCLNLLGKLDNHWYDFREGTDTAGVIGLGNLSIASPNKSRGLYYGATKQKPFLQVMKAVTAPRDCTFVDVGCGKGKVLLLAMEQGFDRVTGLEFSSELCAVARSNVEVVRRRKGLKCPIEIVEGDATDYRVRPEDSVFFLFHPFDAHIMSLFMANVVASVALHPRPIWLIYSYPVHGEVIECSAPFLRCQHYHFGGTPYAVYQSD